MPRSSGAGSTLDLFSVLGDPDPSPVAEPPLVATKPKRRAAKGGDPSRLLEASEGPALRPIGLQVSDEADQVDLKLPERYERPKQRGTVTSPQKHSTMPLTIGAATMKRVGGMPLTSLDKAFWMVLVTNAYDDLNTRTAFRINLAEVRRALSNRMVRGDDGTITISEVEDSIKNNKRLRESAERLQTTLLQWDYGGMDSRVWKSTQMLGGVEFEEGALGEGVITYEFPERIRRLLANPTIFSEIRLRIFVSFTSSDAQALYPILQKEADMKFGKKSWTVSVEDLRTLLDVTPGTLPSFGNLRQKALDPAIQQINDFSEFDVEMVPIHAKARGAPVASVEFRVTRKPGPAPYEMLYLSGKTREQRTEIVETRKAEAVRRKTRKVVLTPRRPAGPVAQDGATAPATKRRSKFTPSN